MPEREGRKGEQVSILEENEPMIEGGTRISERVVKNKCAYGEQN